jgi:N-acetyl-anhydromuramyl-L-alanine amidase AmpD
MNLFFELFYKPYVIPALYPIPIIYWELWSNALASFPTIADPLPGYTQSSRRTKQICLIVMHHTGSLNMANSLKWFSNPNTYSSTNYIIDRDGYTLCLVPEDKAALHTPHATYNHSRLVNEQSIGVTLVGDGVTEFSDVQYEGLAMLCSYWKQKYGLTNENIKKHVEIPHTGEQHIDPSPFSMEKLISLIDVFDNV